MTTEKRTIKIEIVSRLKIGRTQIAECSFDPDRGHRLEPASYLSLAPGEAAGLAIGIITWLQGINLIDGWPHQADLEELLEQQKEEKM